MSDSLRAPNSNRAANDNLKGAAPPLCQVGPYQVGPEEPLLIIAGPCVLEPPSPTMGDVAFAIAERLVEMTSSLPVQFVFKASFDKANRSRIAAYRGPGLEAGLKRLEKIRDQIGVPVTTDIHEPSQARPVAEVCQLLQIPAFLARQTDLLVASASTGRAVNVKKGQFMAPSDMAHVVDKLTESGCTDALLCERGTFFGYGQLVNDMRGLVQMADLGAPVVFDATHSVQYPGGTTGTTTGNRQMVAPLARAAAAVGISGLFFETHPRPEDSPSDAANMVPLAEAESLIRQVVAIRNAHLSFQKA